MAHSLQEPSHKGLAYQVNEATRFYGPKIDFHIEDCLRSWQLGTIRPDFHARAI
jgi:threonyl-tRNA synthetase